MLCHPERSEGPRNHSESLFVYKMTNRSRVVLYTGVTNDLQRRVWEHQNGAVKGFAKTYKIDQLVHYENYDDPRDAIAREKEIKGWLRSKKNALVETLNPKGADLSRTLFEQ
jgi:putative endonuclease